MAKSSITTESLRRWNGWLAAIHAAQAIAILLFAKTVTVPVNTAFLNTDSLQSKLQGHTVLAPAMHHLLDVRVPVLIAIFLGLAALAHLLMATAWRARYEAGLKDGSNHLRWVEYALSGGIMLVIIALLAGMYDDGSLKLLFALTAVANLLFLVMETHNPWRRAMQVKWASYVIGCIAGLVPWLIIAWYLLATQIYGDANTPAYLYVIFGTILLCFIAQAANAFLLYRRKGKWGDYYFGERNYMILSAITKTALAWQIFAGVLK